MVFGRDVPERPVLEHRSTRTDRWLREKRVRLALGIAVVEGLLVAFDVLSVWVALGVAVLAIAFYFWMGRELRSPSARQVSWIAATSQALVALVPVLVIVVGTLALIAVAVLAVGALVVLLADRR
jgi:hypothetical protein